MSNLNLLPVLKNEMTRDERLISGVVSTFVELDLRVSMPKSENSPVLPTDIQVAVKYSGSGNMLVAQMLQIHFPAELCHPLYH